MVFPELAGTGATPQRCAKADSLRSWSGLSPAAMSSEGADHLDVAVTGFRDGRGGTGEHCVCSGLGVERVGLALASADGAVGAVDLEPEVFVATQVAGEVGAPAASALDAEGRHRT